MNYHIVVGDNCISLYIHKLVHLTRNQVLDEDSEFGGVTGWCRALLAVNCFPHQVVLLMTMIME